MKRLALLMAALCAHAFAQQPGLVARYCSTTGDVSLSAAATTFTIQQPAVSSKQLMLESALVTTSVASSFTQAVNGAGATTTAGTVTQTPTTFSTLAATGKSFTASNVGAGTQIAGKISTYAGGPGVSVDLTSGSNVVLKNTGITSNYSITVASMTGTANITVCWSEK